MEIGFAPLVYSVDEGAGVVTFTVQNRNPDLEREVTVQFTTTDGTATGILIHCVKCFKIIKVSHSSKNLLFTIEISLIQGQMITLL